jgi:hypothetical protein
MSIIAIGMNLMLAGLIISALVLGMRLNNRLKALRDSHEGFAKAVAELDAAAQRAEQGLADLRAATDEAHDALADRIEKARALTAKLDRQLQAAPAARAETPIRAVAPARAEPPLRMGAVRRPAAHDELELVDVERVSHRLGSLLSAAREPKPERERPSRREPLAPRPRASFDDDDLFDDEPLRVGARR